MKDKLLKDSRGHTWEEDALGKPHRVQGSRAIHSGDFDAIDELPRRQGMRPQGSWKCYGPNLKPFRRWINRQVGRPWDKIYSQIRKMVAGNALLEASIDDYIERYVTLNCRKAGGKVFATDGELKRSWRRLGPTGKLLYVDQTGILKELKPRKGETNLQVEYERVIGGQYARTNKRGQTEVAVLYGEDDVIPPNTKFVSMRSDRRNVHYRYEWEKHYIRHWRRVSKKELVHWAKLQRKADEAKEARESRERSSRKPEAADDSADQMLRALMSVFG